MQKITTLPNVSIVIPTYNNEDILPCVLHSIKKQSYPQNKIEILVCDGSSSDSTIKIAQAFKCKILHNKKRLAEFGVALGMQKATGDVVMILAADNELFNNDFIDKIVLPFRQESNVMLSFPIQVSSKQETWIARYMNAFTDPINHFIYQYAANTRTFYKKYSVKKKTKDYIIYQFPTIDYPMIALAQGTTISKQIKRSENSFGDDLAPIIDLIRSGKDLAYVPDALLVHHTTKYLKDYIRKQKWAIDNYLTDKNYGVRVRLTYFSGARSFRKYFFLFYAASIIFPIIFSIKGLLVDREKSWFYHPFLIYITAYILIIEVIRIKIVKDTAHTARK